MRPSSDGARVAGNFLRLGAGEVLARGVGFAVLTYLARVLGPEQYGLIGFAYAVILYLATIADFGVETLGPRETGAHAADLERFVSATLTVRVLMGGGLGAALAVYALLGMARADGLILALYGLLLLATGGSARWVHIGLERAGPVGWSRVAGELTRALLTVLLVHGPADVSYVPVVHFVGEGVAAAAMLAALRSRGLRIRPRWDPSVAGPLLRSGWPVVVNVVLGMVLYNSDMLLIRWFRSTAEVGWYFAAYSLISLLGNLSGSYGTNLLPTLARVGSTSEQGRALYRAAIAQVTAAGLPLAVGGFVLAPRLLGLVFGPDYSPAVPVLQVLILTIPLLLVRLVQHAALFARGRQDRVLWATAAAAVLNLGANLVVIPRYGMLGAAATTLAAEVVRTALIQLFVLREGFAAGVLRGSWRPAAASAAMAALLFGFPFGSIWIALMVGAAAYLVSLAAVRGIALHPGRFPALRS